MNGYYLIIYKCKGNSCVTSQSLFTFVENSFVTCETVMYKRVLHHSDSDWYPGTDFYDDKIKIVNSMEILKKIWT